MLKWTTMIYVIWHWHARSLFLADYVVVHQTNVKVLKFSLRYIPCGFIAEVSILIPRGNCIFKVGLCIYNVFHCRLLFLVIRIVKSSSNYNLLKIGVFSCSVIFENVFCFVTIACLHKVTASKNEMHQEPLKRKVFKTASLILEHS